MKNSFRLLPYLFVILALVIVFPLLSGCAGPDKSNRFIQLLRLIPVQLTELTDSPEPLLLTDLASYHEDYGISLTDSEGKPISFEEYTDLLKENEIRQFVGGTNFITGWGPYAQTGIIQEKYLGYDFTSLDAEINAGPPPISVTAAIGRYDHEATREALKNQDEWPSWAIDAYTIEEYRGVTIHSWGDEFKIHLEDRFAPPHIDELGRIRPLAVTDEFLFYAPSVETIKLMIDASQGDIESLADLPEFEAIAGKLPELNVYMACIGYDSLVNGNPEFTGTYPGPRLKKFLTFGSASGKDENGNYIVLVLYHENSDNARANVSLLEERIDTAYSEILEKYWNEIITETDIQVDGNLLVAKLYTESFNLWVSLAYGYEPILLHEE